MSGFIQAAILACQEVDALVKEGNSSLFVLHERGAGGDISNGADLRAEAICFSHLSPYGSI